MTTQQMLIAAIVALWGVCVAAFTYLKTVLEKRVTDKDESCRLLLVEKDTVIVRQDKRIEKLEADKDEERKSRDRALTLAEESVKTQKQQAEISQAMYDKLSQSLNKANGA